MEEAKDYRKDADYIYHYSDRLSPAYIRMALLLAGYDFPERKEGEPFRYLELGFGQGLSLAIHAAANEGEYWGVDFLPGHAEELNKLSASAGLNCRVLCNSFAEVDAMSLKGELPQFDAVVFHGIWSWVNEENRQHILNILDRCLKPGGVVYNSYNAQPGWSFFMPVRDLMTSLVSRYADKGDDLRSVGEVLDDIYRLATEGDMSFFKLNPRVADILSFMKTQPLAYVSQEFFNTSWRAFFFREVAEDMARVGCKFVSSSTVQHQMDEAVSDAASGYIDRILDANIRESLRDYAMNIMFRSDYFMRSPKRLGDAEQKARLSEGIIWLSRPKSQVNYSIDFGSRTVSIQENSIGPLLDRLEEGGRRLRTVGSVFGDMLAKDGGLAAVVQSLRVLIGSRIARVGVMGDIPDEAATRCGLLNRELCREIFEEGGAVPPFVAAAKLGAGITVTRDVMMALYARGDKTEDEWVKTVAGLWLRVNGGKAYSEALEVAGRLVEQVKQSHLANLETVGALW